MGLTLRYRLTARLYDAISAEPVYRPGRLHGIQALDLRPGQTVLDVGCGTGLNLPPLMERLGPTGRVVGLDSSPAMLARARARARRAGWSGVRLVRADATTIAAAELRRCLPAAGADAVLATYALSLMDDRSAAWQLIRSVARPGARVAVVDMRRPDAGAWARALARTATALAGADIDAHPWTDLERDATDVHAASLRAGHVQVRAGTLP